MEPKEVKYCYDDLEGATLEVVELGQKVKTFLLRKYPNRMDMSCYIVFTPFGVVINGDLRVTNRGVVAHGYGIDWFAGRLDYDYLAGKFLERNKRGNFDPWEVGWLCAIQRKFAELYPALLESGTSDWRPDPYQEPEPAKMLADVGA